MNLLITNVLEGFISFKLKFIYLEIFFVIEKKCFHFKIRSLKAQTHQKESFKKLKILTEIMFWNRRI